MTASTATFLIRLNKSKATLQIPILHGFNQFVPLLRHALAIIAISYEYKILVRTLTH